MVVVDIKPACRHVCRHRSMPYLLPVCMPSAFSTSGPCLGSLGPPPLPLLPLCFLNPNLLAGNDSFDKVRDLESKSKTNDRISKLDQPSHVEDAVQCPGAVFLQKLSIVMVMCAMAQPHPSQVNGTFVNICLEALR